MQRRWLVISGSLEAYAAASKQELSAVIGDETDGKPDIGLLSYSF